MSEMRDKIAARLRAAREATGLTQTQVARLMDMHRPTVSEIEAGRRGVTSEELYGFAQAYGVSVSELLEGSLLEEVESVLFRREDLAGPETRMAIHRFAERCRSEAELEAMLGIVRGAVERPKYSPRMSRTPREAVEQGEDLATRERARLGLGEEPVRNLVELLERQGLRVGPLQGVADEGLDGVYFEARTLGPCVAINVDRDPWTGFRTAFTVAHEYLHWLLDDTRGEPVRQERFTTDLREVRANAFAAALLMPREGIYRYFNGIGLIGANGRIEALRPPDVVRAMDYFGVSRAALLNRLRDLKLLAQRTWAELRRQEFSVLSVASTLGLRLRMEYNLDVYFSDLVVRAWSKGLVTSGRAADLLGLEVDEFRQRMAEMGVELATDVELILGGA